MLPAASLILGVDTGMASIVGLLLAIVAGFIWALLIRDPSVNDMKYD